MASLERIEPKDGVVVYRSALLASHGFRHAFSTRHGGVSPEPFGTMNLGIASAPGESVTFTVTVAAAAPPAPAPTHGAAIAGVPGGVVTLRIDGAVVATLTLDADGTVRYVTDALAPGTPFSNATTDVVMVLSSAKRLGF